MRPGDVKTGDDLLTWLFSASPEEKTIKCMSMFTTSILRDAADLCGVDSVDMTKRQAITAILENF